MNPLEESMILAMSNVAALTIAGNALAILSLLLAVVIVAKAVRGYRQNDDPAMLLLAVGLFLLVLAPIITELTVIVFISEAIEAQVAVNVLGHVLRIAGLGAILASMYVPR